MRKITMFQSECGRIFNTVEKCADFEGLHKCINCEGTGVEKYEHVIPYPSGLPDSGWVDDTIEIRERPCTKCNANGYVAERPQHQDPEFDEYVRLVAKFGPIDK